MRKGETALDPLPPFPQFELVFVRIIWIVLDVMGQHTLRGGIVRSYTWGEAHLLLSLYVSRVSVL